LGVKTTIFISFYLYFKIVYRTILKKTRGLPQIYHIRNAFLQLLTTEFAISEKVNNTLYI